MIFKTHFRMISKMTCSISDCNNKISQTLAKCICIGCANKFCGKHMRKKAKIPTEAGGQLFNSLCYKCYSEEISVAVAASRLSKIGKLNPDIHLIVHREKKLVLHYSEQMKAYVMGNVIAGACGFNTKERAENLRLEYPELKEYESIPVSEVESLGIRFRV
jgi:hypothetical protein